MAKASLFTVRNLAGEKPTKLTAPPTKISEYRLRAGEWKVTKPAAKKKPGRKAKSVRKSSRKTKKTPKAAEAEAAKAPRSAGAVLGSKDPEWQCSHCGRTADDANCGAKCYREFRKTLLKDSSIEIRGPGPLGYSAHLAPAATAVEKDTVLGEYIGELLPLSLPATPTSLYRIEIPDVCAIDAEQAGNWTRFANSSCAPNVRTMGEFVGKRHLVWLEALRAIQPGEELTFQYGKQYFKYAGFQCRCAAVEGDHYPGDKLKAAKVVAAPKKSKSRK